MQKLLISLMFCTTLLLGCSTHKLEIQQGNVIDQEAVAQLQIGMTKKQVKFIMGTPLLTDPFHQDRWDYIYTFKQARQAQEEKRITLYFEGDILSRIEPPQWPLSNTSAIDKY